MVIDHSTVGSLPKPWTDRLRGAQVETNEPILTGPILVGSGLQLPVAPAGSMQLSIGADHCFFAVAFSYLDQSTMKFDAVAP